MKIRNLVPLVLLALVVVFVSCSQGPGKMIARTWKVSDVVAKGTVNDSIFQLQKAQLMKVEMTFKNDQYTMSSIGNVIESGTYTVEGDKLVVRTEQGMNMDASVTKDRLNLNTPDFTITLIPK